MAYNKVKQKLKYRTSQEWEVFSNFEYGNNMQLEYIHTSEGRVRNDGGNFKYDYYLKDHLGNTRVVFTEENGAAKELQVSNYYPFGMRFNQSNTYDIAGKTSQYMYNGKELQEDFDLDCYDYGARFYDPALGRYHVQDPLTDFMPGITPYHYCYNNPMGYTDEYGMWGDPKKKRERKQKRQNRKRARQRKRDSWKSKNSGSNKKTQKYYNYFVSDVYPNRPLMDYTYTGDRNNDKRNDDNLNPLARIEANIPGMIGDPALTITPTPVYKGRPVRENVNFSEKIGFDFKSDNYNLEATEKTLSDLVKTLKEYPQLQLIICGNAWGNVQNVTNTPQAWGVRSSNNGTQTTLGGLASARARAVRNYLIGKGIDSNRIRAWRGNIYPDSERGQSTSFELQNQ